MNYLKFLVLLVFTFFLVGCSKAQKVVPTSIYNISIKDINGVPLDLHQFKGKKILFVNVASKCGFTHQYKGLQELYDTYKDQLVVVGVPCNQFGSQEPGTNAEIKSFCTSSFNVTFPMTEKINVKGDKQHPIYGWLTQKSKNGVQNSTVKWNFQKYLVDEKGKFIDFWYSVTEPTSTKITAYLKK